MEKVTGISNRPIVAFLLGLIPGLLSTWGIGHIFSGKIGRGILFLLIGLILSPVATFVALSLSINWGDWVVLLIIGMIVWVLLWLYQSVDAYWEAGGE